jgi:hypothetical protein
LSLDEEVRRTVETAYDDVVALRGGRLRLDALAEALLERETLDQIDATASRSRNQTPSPSTENLFRTRAQPVLDVDASSRPG